MVMAIANPACQAPELKPVLRCLADAPMFELSTDSLYRLSSTGRRIVFKRHQVIFEEASEATAVFLLCEGAVKLMKNLEDGREQVVALFFEPTVIGFPIGQGYPFTAETLTATTLVRFPLAVFSEMRRDQPELDRALFNAANRDLNQAFERLTWLGQQTAREKVARFLLSLTPRPGFQQDSGEQFWLPVRQCDIANYLGLSPETLSRIWAGFRRQRIIVQDEPGFVSIPSRGALEALVA